MVILVTMTSQLGFVDAWFVLIPNSNVTIDNHVPMCPNSGEQMLGLDSPTWVVGFFLQPLWPSCTNGSLHVPYSKAPARAG